MTQLFPRLVACELESMDLGAEAHDDGLPGFAFAPGAVEVALRGLGGTSQSWRVGELIARLMPPEAGKRLARRITHTLLSLHEHLSFLLAVQHVARGFTFCWTQDRDPQQRWPAFAFASESVRLVVRTLREGSSEKTAAHAWIALRDMSDQDRAQLPVTTECRTQLQALLHKADAMAKAADQAPKAFHRAQPHQPHGLNTATRQGFGPRMPRDGPKMRPKAGPQTFPKRGNKPSLQAPDAVSKDCAKPWSKGASPPCLQPYHPKTKPKPPRFKNFDVVTACAPQSPAPAETPAAQEV